MQFWVNLWYRPPHFRCASLPWGGCAGRSPQVATKDGQHGPSSGEHTHRRALYYYKKRENQVICVFILRVCVVPLRIAARFLVRPPECTRDTWWAAVVRVMKPLRIIIRHTLSADGKCHQNTCHRHRVNRATHRQTRRCSFVCVCRSRRKSSQSAYVSYLQAVGSLTWPYKWPCGYCGTMS